MFKSYYAPRNLTLKKGQSIAERFLAGLDEFTKKCSWLQTTHLRENLSAPSPSPTERIVSYGLAFGRTLLKSPAALNLRVKSGGHAHITKRLGEMPLSKDFEIQLMNEVHYERVRTPYSSRPSIWYDGKKIIVAYTMPQRDEEGYLVFFKVAKLTDIKIQTFLTAFKHVFEEALTSTLSMEFLLDQKRLLSRRTIVAQFRPNDLFYQALRRLHKYVGWERSALILAAKYDGPTMRAYKITGKKRTAKVRWYIAAERLRGVSEVSQRVGMLYNPVIALSPEGDTVIAPRIVENLAELQGGEVTPWEHLIYRVLSDRKGLPRSLPPSGSALIVPIGIPNAPIAEVMVGEAASILPIPFIVVLSDPRPARFNKEHQRLVQEFFSDINQLLEKSGTVSQRLIKLWTPQRRIAGEDVPADKQPDQSLIEERPDAVETLDSEALADEALDVLGVSALQIIQLRRGAIRGINTAEVEVLAAVSAQRVNDSGESAEQDFKTQPSEFIRKTRYGQKVTPKADILWRVLDGEIEYSHKELKGLDPKRLANLLAPEYSEVLYKTVYITPIRSEGEIAGALLAFRRTQSEFADMDRLLIRSLAERLGERIELHRKLADRLRLVICLSLVAAASDAAAARHTLVESARKILNADHAFMMIVREPLAGIVGNGAPEIEDVAHTWDDNEMYVPRINATAEGITGAVYMTGESLVVPDVSTYKKYVSLRTPAGKAVKIASELAIPIKMPFSSKGKSSKVLGVLDALWKQPHKITVREVNTLRALANHAAALLQLTSGFQEATQMRNSLQNLLNKAIGLQESKTEEEILEWLASTILGEGDQKSNLIDCDLMVVWQHERDSKSLDILLVKGERAYEIKDKKRPFEGWIATVIQRFREGKLKSAFDHYDRPAPERKHIAGTKRDKYQSVVARCIVPELSAAHGEAAEPQIVWAVSLYKFRQSNFDDHDGVLLQFAAEYCEAASQKIHFDTSQERTLQLAKTAQDVGLRMLNRLRINQSEVVEYICERIWVEMKAWNVSILYYEAGTPTVPTRFSYPKLLRQTDAPRKDGLSEKVRNIEHIVVVEDITNPPSELAEAIKSSPFLNKNPQIRSFIAVPLYEVCDDASTGKFFGLMYINYQGKYVPSAAELEFLSIMQRYLAECGGIEGKLLQMRAESLRNIQKIIDPGQVFKQILTVALEKLESEFPLSVHNSPGFELRGNLYMITQGDNWVKLRVRDNIGELTGKQAGVQDIGEGVVGWVAKHGKPKIVEDTRAEESRELGYLPYLKNMRSELAVPITLPEAPGIHRGVLANGVIGVLNVECSLPNVFTARHQNLLVRFAAAPVALILYLAERHGQRLWQVRKDEDDFLMDVAIQVVHDLTRPMRNLGLTATAIRDYLNSSDVKNVESILRDMEQESKNWNEIKRTGLHFLRQEILEEREELDVVELVKAWAARQKPKVNIVGRGIFEFYIPKGHNELIASILDNLYSNSIKVQKSAQQKNGRVWIELKKTPEFSELGQYLDVYFNDNGPGIKGYTPETWGELFRPLKHRVKQNAKRAQEYRRKAKATDGSWGLGLPVVRQMMHIMGGKVDIVDSQPYYRTTFRLRFMAQPVVEIR